MKTFTDLKNEFINSEAGWKTKSKVTQARSNENVFPAPADIFAAFNDNVLPIDKVKLVIVGQDPYPTIGHANGYAFSSSGNIVPYSLGIIFEEIVNTIYPYMNNDTEMKKKYFGSPNLMNWTKQGILLMNRVLTVSEGKPDSHKDFGWQIFTDSVIRELNNSLKPIVFLLMGSNAKSVAGFITNPIHKIIQTNHPASEAYKPGSFIGCGCFLDVYESLGKFGHGESIKMNISEWIEQSYFCSMTQKMIVNKRYPVLKTYAESIKANIRLLMEFNYDVIIYFKTLND